MVLPAFVTRRFIPLVAAAALAALAPADALAQGLGTVSGRVTRAGEATALAGVTVSVRETGLTTVTRNDGRYTLRRVPEGAAVEPGQGSLRVH